jgi:hypothetical protein
MDNLAIVENNNLERLPNVARFHELSSHLSHTGFTRETNIFSRKIVVSKRTQCQRIGALSLGSGCRPISWLWALNRSSSRSGPAGRPIEAPLLGSGSLLQKRGDNSAGGIRCPKIKCDRIELAHPVDSLRSDDGAGIGSPAVLAHVALGMRGGCGHCCCRPSTASDRRLGPGVSVQRHVTSDAKPRRDRLRWGRHRDCVHLSI